MQVYTSYFYQIRNFLPNMIPISTCISDPNWYHDFKEKTYCFFDKRGVYCGLRWDYLIVQRKIECTCPCTLKNPLQCDFLNNYKKELSYLDFNKVKNGINFLIQKTANKLCIENPIPVFIFYEIPKNKCSEREIFQSVFKENGINISELEYPIRSKNYDLYGQ